MGQTLTHGVYLPNEGERNCYNGLASNWRLLDGAIGTVAAHTTAIAVKADISHTHGNISNDGKVGTDANKPLITGTGGAVQAGSFGNAANTFCEGNDSRLSDARTPVAHTHTKSDVTDLLNSNFIPSANNSYDLGSSSYQWNNLYAKNYFYNGVEFQNKFVTLDSVQAITGEKTFSNNIFSKNYNYSRGTIPSTSQYNTFTFRDNSNNESARLLRWFNADGYNGMTLQSWDAQLTTDTSVFFQLQYDPSGNGQAVLGGNNFKEFIPLTNNSIDLGTSSRKWKTLWANAINSVPTDTVEWHNSHYRGINLISTGHFANMAALLTAIRNQDWSDIYIGDYVELTFTYEGASRTVKFYVGEIDKFYKVGDTSLETHHLVMVTGDLGINQVMNDSNTTAGGYVGSKAHTVTLPALYAILNPLFNNAILTHRNWLSNSVATTQSVNVTLKDSNNVETPYTITDFPLYSSGDPNTPGCVTTGNWYDCNLVLMSEIEMFGSNRFSSSGIDDIMCPEGQIAAFKYNRNLQTLNHTINTWLRNVNSASRFCRCFSFGHSLRSDAASTIFQLRPRFLIG